MTEKELYDWTEKTLRTAFKTITPWRRTFIENPELTEIAKLQALSYDAGWNDCIREIRKSRVTYLKKLAEMKPKK